MHAQQTTIGGKHTLSRLYKTIKKHEAGKLHSTWITTYIGKFHRYVIWFITARFPTITSALEGCR